MPGKRLLWGLAGATVLAGCYAIAEQASDAGPIVMHSSGVNDNQVVIIKRDSMGNESVLRIGGQSGSVVIGYQPCDIGAPTEQMDCAGQDLQQVQWQGASLAGSRFDRANLTGAVLRDAGLANASFERAILNGADLRNASLTNADFSRADLQDARLDDAKIINGDFERADLSAASLRRATLINADFDRAQIGRADLRGANVLNVDFDEALGKATALLDGGN
jgi:uncharacterized protein YjbI with pentapeptide repeats